MGKEEKNKGKKKENQKNLKKEQKKEKTEAKKENSSKKQTANKSDKEKLNEKIADKKTVEKSSGKKSQEEITIPIYEVNEITEETIKKEEAKKEKKEKEEKAKERKRKRDVFKNKFKEFFSKYDSEKILGFLLIIFIINMTIRFGVFMYKISNIRTSIPVVVSEEKLEESESFNISNINEINLNLETFDVLIRKTDEGTEKLRVKYSRKYDKKVNFKIKDGKFSLEEKNKIFKTFKFKNRSNLMIIEIPTSYENKINIKNMQGRITIEEYNRNKDEEINKLKEKLNRNPILDIYSF